MTVFNSNAEEIKYYTKELLTDGREHTRSEIIDYVIKKSGRNDFTEGNYSGSLNDLVRRHQIMIVKRGVYSLFENPSSTKVTPQTSIVELDTLDKQCIDILVNTIKELQKTANKVNILNISDEEQQLIQKIKKVIINLDTDIKLFEDEIFKEE